MSLAISDSREINGRTYQSSVLNLEEGRKVYARLQPLFRYYGEDLAHRAGVGFLQAAGMKGELGDADIKFLTDAFAKKTTVSYDADGESRMQALTKDGVLDACFAGQFEDLFAWLDFCVELNFRGVIEKMRAAYVVLVAEAAKAAVSE